MTEGKAHSMRNAYVRPGLPRARAAEADLVTELAEADASAEAAWHQACEAELVACTLGARERPELIRRTVAAAGERLADALDSLASSLQAFAAAHRRPFHDSNRED